MTSCAHTLLVALLLIPIGAAAQPPDTTDMQAALLAVRERGSPSLASHFLSQERRPHSAQQLEALADSLVEIAVAFESEGSHSEQRAASAAIGALVFAAQSDRTVPYPHALEALGRIYEGSTEAGVRAAVLWDMTQLPNQGAALDFLTEVASSPEVTAPIAIGHIVQEMGQAGLARLRRLYEDGSALNPVAREHLDALAHVHGWGGAGIWSR